MIANLWQDKIIASRSPPVSIPGVLNPLTTATLVSTEWLARHLDDPHVRVLDVSGHLDDDKINLAHDDYLAAHIPGAVWCVAAAALGRNTGSGGTSTICSPGMRRASRLVASTVSWGQRDIK